MGCSMAKWDVETKQCWAMRVAAWTHFYGCPKSPEQTRRGNTSEQDVATKNQVDWIHQRACHCKIDHSQHAANIVDECFLSPHGVCRPSCRKSTRNNWETHKIQNEHSNRRWRLLCWTWTRNWCWAPQCWTTHHQRDEQARRLDEAVADVAEIRRADHNVQENTSKTS